MIKRRGLQKKVRFGAHISADDNEFKEALNAQEINAELYTQAVNSPDVNLLDLGFFPSYSELQ